MLVSVGEIEDFTTDDGKDAAAVALALCVAFGVCAI
jgi:hypothetical protein